MAYCMDILNGTVNKTPIQNPIKPTKEPKKATIIRRKIVKNCLLDILILAFIASIAFCLPKMINGMASVV